MLINDIKKWVEVEDEWFFGFLAKMTRENDYGDSFHYPDDVVIDADYINLHRWTYDRCGGSDYHNAIIPVIDVLKNLRKEKIQKINN